jgi:ribA/ribD-fused uncharacterized protein
MLERNSQVNCLIGAIMRNPENLILNKAHLIQAIHAGFHPKYLFFWGHSAKGEEIGKSCLSQWFVANFEIDGICYQSAEHYMMAEKARLFHDETTLNKIIHARHPGEAKNLGREIQHFELDVWQQHRFDIVVQGNVAKFQQNASLKQFLLNTGERVLVEASPVDKIWGIGLAENQTETLIPEKWPGLNLLGFALMKTRDMITSL